MFCGRLFDWISENKECTVAIVTLVVSVLGVVFACKQTQINNTLTQLQIANKQPFFRIGTFLEEDLDDGSYGTEHIVVKNKGYSNVVPKIEGTVIFRLKKCCRGENDSVFIEVGDYFNTTSSDGSDDEIVYHSFGKGNNRRFHDLYVEAMNDKNEEGVLCFLDKIIIVHIDYTDLLKKKHSAFFINKEEVDETTYKKVISQIHHEVFYLNNIKYKDIKAALLSNK